MEQMNLSDLYNTIISGAFALAVGLIGVYAGRKDARSIAQRKIYEMQLTELWEPIIKELLLSNAADPIDTYNKVQQITYQNYTLVPNDLLREIDRLGNKNELADADFTCVKEISASHYNWIRRSLGYPHDSRRIKLEHTPKSKTNILFYICFNGLSILLFFTSLLIVFSHYAALVDGIHLNTPEWMLRWSTYILVIGFAWMLFNLPHRK